VATRWIALWLSLSASCASCTSLASSVDPHRWLTRGARLGELARVYCATGSTAERRLMAEAVALAAAPAHVTITCPE